MPTLETDRLILRDFVPNDWDALNAIVSDPAVTRFMHFASWDEAKRSHWLAYMVEEAAHPHPYTDNWAITLRTSGQVIGWLYIGASREVAEAGTRGCGYALDPQFWGQGYMTEALRRAFTYEFTVLGTQRITAECETPNTASARVMQKCGMTNTGTFYDAEFEGNWRERHHFTITTAATDTP
jgi:[ribosomal protein S5]-alanine N-acetyltransferase